MENEVMFIKLEDIIPNRFQPRENFEEEALNKLADSIRKHGVIEPILVRPVSNKFEIVAGERRYKASVLAGLTKIPAIVKPMDDKESSIIAYIENEHRSDVSAIEEARTIDRILKNNNMTQEELAGELGINQSTLANKLRLLALPMEIQNSLMHNEISERHARSLLSVKDEGKQIELLNKIKENKMTVRELDSEIKSMNNGNDLSNNELNEYINDIPAPVNEPIMPIDSTHDDGFMEYLNNNDKYSPAIENVPNIPPADRGVMDYLNDFSNNPTNETPSTDIPPIDKDVNDYLNDINNSISDNRLDNIPPADTNFDDILNNYDNKMVDNYANDLKDTDLTDNGDDNPGFMDFLNNYDTNNPLPPEDNNINDYNEPLSSSDSILDNYNESLPSSDSTLNNHNESLSSDSIINNNEPLPTEVNDNFDIPVASNESYLNNTYEVPHESNVVINDVNPPITSNFDDNSYIENNPNYVDVSQKVVISSVDEIINKLKVVVDDIKAKSKFKVDTDEINYDDIYQITIKIDKRDF